MSFVCVYTCVLWKEVESRLSRRCLHWRQSVRAVAAQAAVRLAGETGLQAWDSGRREEGSGSPSVCRDLSPLAVKRHPRPMNKTCPCVSHGTFSLNVYIANSLCNHPVWRKCVDSF